MSKTSTNRRNPKAPTHLQEATRAWWRDVVRDYLLEPHHLRLLTLAGESWDRCQQAREAVTKDGAYIRDRWGQLKAHPGIAVERDNKIAFARLIREIDLDCEGPAASPQPPALRRYGGRS